nr:hypothetical protein [Protofrankia symbiont of Coriaria ruscifolia]
MDELGAEKAVKDGHAAEVVAGDGIGRLAFDGDDLAVVAFQDDVDFGATADPPVVEAHRAVAPGGLFGQFVDDEGL